MFKFNRTGGRFKNPFVHGARRYWTANFSLRSFSACLLQQTGSLRSGCLGKQIISTKRKKEKKEGL